VLPVSHDNQMFVYAYLRQAGVTALNSEDTAAAIAVSTQRIYRMMARWQAVVDKYDLCGYSLSNDIIHIVMLSLSRFCPTAGSCIDGASTQRTGH